MTNEKTKVKIANDDLAYKVTFVNRQELCGEIESEIHKLSDNKNYKKVILIYGQKGIGKTSLLEYANSIAKRERNLISIRIFNPHVENAFLHHARMQINEKCLRFDYAVQKIDPSKDYITRAKKKKKIKIIGYILFDFSGIMVDLAYLVRDTFRGLLPSSAEKEIKKEIDSSYEVAGKLQQILPSILADDINSLISDRGRKFVFLVDIQDTRLEFAASKKWLWELVKRLKAGVVIVATQENVKLDIEFDCIHLVTRLDDSYVEEILDHNGIDDPAIRCAIINASQGIPLEVHKRIEKYFEQINYGKSVDIELISSSLKEIALDTLDNLQGGFRQLIVAISVFRIFTHGIYSELCRSMGIAETNNIFDDFTKTTLIEPCADRTQVLQLVSHYWNYGFADELDSASISAALDIYAKHFSKPFLESIDDDALIRIYENTLKLLVEYDTAPPLLTETCLDISYVMYNRGKWFEMMEGLQVLQGTPLDNGSLCRFISGHALRKIDSSEAGEQCLIKINGADLVGAEYHHTAQAELTYVDCLKGNYDAAYIGFSRDYEWVSKNNKDPNDPRYFKMYLNYADITFLRGDFKKSKMLLLELKNMVAEHRGVEYVEIIRAIGHVYRFNLMFEQAEEQYLKAKEYAQGNAALQAKLLTNLTETLASTDPRTAIKFGEQAITANQSIGSVLEMGKANAALGLAYLLQKRYDDAFRSIRRAQEGQSNAKYPAGVLFGMVSEFMFYTATRDARRQEQTARGIYDMTTKLNVYRYLGILPALAMEREEEAAALEKECHWLNASILDGYREIINKLSR